MHEASSSQRIYTKNNFRLVGYFNPIERYPATVVPIIQEKESTQKYYVRWTEEKAVTIELESIRKYTEIDNRDKKLYSEFDFEKQKLFAFSDKDLELYDASEEAKFYRKVITNRVNLDNSHNHFLYFNLAEKAKDFILLYETLRQCEEKEEIAENWKLEKITRSLLPNIMTKEVLPSILVSKEMGNGLVGIVINQDNFEKLNQLEKRSEIIKQFFEQDLSPILNKIKDDQAECKMLKRELTAEQENVEEQKCEINALTEELNALKKKLYLLENELGALKKERVDLQEENQEISEEAKYMYRAITSLWQQFLEVDGRTTIPEMRDRKLQDIDSIIMEHSKREWFSGDFVEETFINELKLSELKEFYNFLNSSKFKQSVNDYKKFWQELPAKYIDITKQFLFRTKNTRNLLQESGCPNEIIKELDKIMHECYIAFSLRNSLSKESKVAFCERIRGDINHEILTRQGVRSLSC